MAERRSARRGQALLIFGIMSVVMIGFVALVTDGGISFVERRKAQTAADLIARAGALAKGNGKSDAGIYQAMSEAAVANGYSPSEVTMEYVASNGTTVATVGAGTAPATASGTRATVTHSFNTFFAGFLNRPQSTTTATAAMSIGALTGFLGGAPLIVCNPATRLDGSAEDTILLSDGSVDPTKVGTEYEIWGDNADGDGIGGRNCTPAGSSSNSFKGVADNDGNNTAQGSTCSALPCAYNTSTGTVSGPTRVRLAQAISYGGTSYSGCDASNYSSGSSGCVLLAPVGDMTSSCGGTTVSAGGNKICVKGWALFLLTNSSSCTGNCKQSAILLGNGVVVNGTAGTCNLATCPDATDTGPKAYAAID